MPVCTQSGYALWTVHDEIYRFDEKGNDLARRLIERQSRDRNWRVSVEGVMDGDLLSVSRIRLTRAKIASAARW